MHIVFLKFTPNKGLAGEYREGHKAWLQRGFAAGVFLLAGSLEPRLGGMILAHRCSREELEVRVKDDPFVANGVVEMEIHEVDPGRADERLQFLLA
jgi:uncharacterized protein YciI